MKIKTLATAIVFTALPTLTLAAGCNSAKEKQAMSCAAGSAYDSATKTCMPVST